VICEENYKEYWYHIRCMIRLSEVLCVQSHYNTEIWYWKGVNDWSTIKTFSFSLSKNFFVNLLQEVVIGGNCEHSTTHNILYFYGTKPQHFFFLWQWQFCWLKKLCEMIQICINAAFCCWIALHKSGLSPHMHMSSSNSVTKIINQCGHYALTTIYNSNLFLFFLFRIRSINAFNQ